MSKSDLNSPALNYRSSDSFDPSMGSPARNQGERSVRRLVVLVPAGADYTASAMRVWELAQKLGSRVQFLGLYGNAAQEPGIRRQLVAMAAMVQVGQVRAEMCLETGNNWLSAARSILQDGDMIVCLGEQRTGLLQTPLKKILESNLKVPVYVIPGLATGKRPRPNWLSQVIVWIGSLGIIAGFTMIQIRVVSMPDDWAQTALMILSVLAEAWLIWTWNGLFG